MTNNDERPPGDAIEPPDELDDGIAFAYGDDSNEHSSPSVIERIAETAGSKPKVLLRDEQFEASLFDQNWARALMRQSKR